MKGTTEEDENLTTEEGSEKGKKKKEKKEGGLPIPLIIGGAAGLIILIALSVVIGTIVASNLVGPKQAENTEVAAEPKEKKKKSPQEDEDDPDAPYVNDMYTFEPGKVTTNTKGSIDTYIVIELSMDFKPYDPEDEKMKELINEKGEVNKESSMYTKLLVQVKSQMTNMLASYTEADLQASRANLSDLMKTQLKPIFRKFELKLGEVHVVTFLIQRT